MSALLVGGWIGSSAVGQSPTTQPPVGTGAEAPKPPTTALIPEAARKKFYEKDIAGAYDELVKAAKGNPAAPHPRVQLAGLFYENRDGQNARRMLELAATEGPQHPDVYLTNANWAFGEGRITDAILNLQAALKLADSNTDLTGAQRARFTNDARVGLAYCFETRGDWNSAYEHVKALMDAEPKNTTYRSRLGVLQFRRQKHEEALEAFKQAYKDDATIDPPELRMAMLWAQTNDAAKTKEWLDKAMTAHSKVPQVHRGYAMFLMNENDLAGADTHLKTAESLSPQSSTARDTMFLRGLYYRYKKNWAEAEKIFDELNRKYRADIEVSANLALTLAESTDKAKQEQGLGIADTIVRQASQQSGSYEVLAWCNYKLGRLDDAEKAITTAASGRQLSLDGAYYLSRILTDRGKLEDAYAILRETLTAKGQFVYRDDAKKLFDELDKKLPKEKKEKKKPEEKKDEKKDDKK
jgi:tetratricopeptide (TPR) repeat protein